MSDAWGVKCNLIAARSDVAAGALAWVRLTNPGNCADRIEVVIRSRGGRRIQLWLDSKYLTNFRAAWMPENMRDRCNVWGTRAEAESWAQEKHKPEAS
jgi:hypothetical protein